MAKRPDNVGRTRRKRSAVAQEGDVKGGDHGDNFARASKAFDDAVEACNDAFGLQLLSEEGADRSLENTLAVIYVQSEAAERDPDAFDAYLDEKGIRRHGARSVYHYMVELLEGVTKAHNKSRYASAIEFLAEEETPRNIEAAVEALKQNGGPSGCADKMARRRASQNKAKRGRRSRHEIGRERLASFETTSTLADLKTKRLENGLVILVAELSDSGTLSVFQNPVQNEQVTNAVLGHIGKDTD